MTRYEGLRDSGALVPMALILFVVVSPLMLLGVAWAVVADWLGDA